MLRADNRRMRSLLSEAQRSLITLLMVLLWLLWFQEWRWGWQCARRLFSGTYQLNEAIIHVISSAAAPFSPYTEIQFVSQGKGILHWLQSKTGKCAQQVVMLKLPLLCLHFHYCKFLWSHSVKAAVNSGSSATGGFDVRDVGQSPFNSFIWLYVVIVHCFSCRLRKKSLNPAFAQCCVAGSF